MLQSLRLRNTIHEDKPNSEGRRRQERDRKTVCTPGINEDPPDLDDKRNVRRTNEGEYVLLTECLNFLLHIGVIRDHFAGNIRPLRKATAVPLESLY